MLAKYAASADSMPRLNLPQKSSSQASSKPTPADQNDRPRPSVSRLPMVSAWAVTCCSCGYSALPAMPSWARASRMRRPAVLTPGFKRCASATRKSSTGSPNVRHHSSYGTGARGGAASASARHSPPDQSRNHGTWGRTKSGPTVVHEPSASAAASAISDSRPRIAAVAERITRRASRTRWPAGASRPIFGITPSIFPVSSFHYR